MDKKAALELSINAIVIVVLAMTLLGLGLGFIRGMFGKLSGLSDATFEKISEDLNTNLATSEAPLLFSKTRVTLEKGTSSLEAFGVRNDGDETIRYGITIETVNCPDTAKDESGKCEDVSSWFNYFVGAQQYTVRPAERQVNKVQITIPGGSGSKSGLYLFKIAAYTDLEAPAEGSLPLDTFGQTELFLTVA